MATTDPFGYNTLASQLPGSTSLPAPTTTATVPKSYEYAGQGWNDPLAHEVYKEFSNPGLFESRSSTPSAYDQLLNANKAYTGNTTVNYVSPTDPKSWGGAYRGNAYDQMKEAYLARGGQGTYEQLAATDPTSVGWPTDAEGNPLPKLDTSTGKTLSADPTTGLWGESTVESGSTHALAPEVLAKMWAPPKP